MLPFLTGSCFEYHNLAACIEIYQKYVIECIRVTETLQVRSTVYNNTLIMWITSLLYIFT